MLVSGPEQEPTFTEKASATSLEKICVHCHIAQNSNNLRP